MLFGFLMLFLIDRIITLVNYSFIYTDLDQLIVWNCAVDYSKGIFHEPFFYGQSYNYVFEAFLSVPLLWMGIPVHIALPISTTLISILPYLILTYFLWRRKEIFWACFALSIPILLPLEYNLLTSMPRGFVQAHLFVSLLFIPLFAPEKKSSVSLFFIGTGLCFFANQSSIVFIFPIGLWLYQYHYKSWIFYLKTLWIIPFFALDLWAKYFYKLHPEYVLHELQRIDLFIKTLIVNLNDLDLFEYLLPITKQYAFIYPYLFILFAVFCFWKKKYREFIFVLSTLIIILVALAIPKTQEKMIGMGVFFTPSRLFLFLPLLLIVISYLSFRKLQIKKAISLVLLFITVVFFLFKNYHSESSVTEITSQTQFSVVKIENLKTQILEAENFIKEHQVDALISAYHMEWKTLHLGFAYYPLSQKSNPLVIIQAWDRRNWLYDKANAKTYNSILLYGFSPNEDSLKKLDYIQLNSDYILIKNNKKYLPSLMKSLNEDFTHY